MFDTKPPPCEIGNEMCQQEILWCGTTYQQAHEPAMLQVPYMPYQW